MPNQIIVHHLLMTRRRLFEGTFSLNRFISIPPNYKSFHSNSYSSSLANNNNGRSSSYDYDDNVNDALKSFDVMIHQRPVPSVVRFTRLLHHLTQLKHYSCSLDLFKQMCAFGLPVNKYTAGIAVKCYYRLRHSKHGLTVMGFCFKQGVEPHVSTCNTLLKGFTREQMTYEAEQLFRLMNRRQRCEPNLATYKIMIEGLCKVGSHYAAIGLLNLIHHGRLGDGCKVDVAMYNFIFDGLCKDGALSDLYRLLREMIFRKGITSNIHTYNTWIYGISKFGYWDMIFMVFREMETDNVHPDVKTFNVIVDALCKQGKIDEAQAVINIMVETGGKYLPDVDTYNSLIEAYGWRNEMHEARRIFDSLASKSIKPNTVTYNKLVLGYIWDANRDEAKKFYNLSSNRIFANFSWGFRRTSKLHYKECLSFRDKYKDAVGLFHLMDGSGWNSDTDMYIILIHRAIKCRKFDDARRLFHDLCYAHISEHKKKQLNAISFRCLQGNLDRAGRHEIFKAWFRRIY